jgi:Superinfection immunity protein
MAPWLRALAHLPADCCTVSAYLPSAQPLASVSDVSALAAVITIVTGVYLAPAMIAALRESRWTLSIMSLNMFAGWTVAGWLIALIWAFRSSRDLTPPVGDAS